MAYTTLHEKSIICMLMIQIIKALMKRTYYVRRKEILENPTPLNSLFVQYPPLKDPDEVSRCKYSYSQASFQLDIYVMDS